jgi:hypothetical protein
VGLHSGIWFGVEFVVDDLVVDGEVVVEGECDMRVSYGLQVNMRRWNPLMVTADECFCWYGMV